MDSGILRSVMPPDELTSFFIMKYPRLFLVIIFILKCILYVRNAFIFSHNEKYQQNFSYNKVGKMFVVFPIVSRNFLFKY